MPDFGFTIQKDRQIDFDKNDRWIANFVRQQEPSFSTCISCGTCSSVCSAAAFTDYSLRRMFILIKRGEVFDIEKEISKCMFCGKCQLACPRGVNTRNVILLIQKALEKNSKK